MFSMLKFFHKKIKFLQEAGHILIRRREKSTPSCDQYDATKF